MMLKIRKCNLLQISLLVFILYFASVLTCQGKGVETESVDTDASNPGNDLVCLLEDDIPVTVKEYTIMVYMIGSNLESRLGNGTKDIMEMEKSGLDYSKSNLLVYTGGSRRWAGKVDSGFNSILDLSRGIENRLVARTKNNTDMGLPETLAGFVNFCTEKYPANHYALIFWDHGGGPLFGFGNDELFQSDSLLLSEMKTAMNQTEFSYRKKLDWVGFDACLMGSLECMNLWSDYAYYFVGSEELEPGDGWDYTFLETLNVTQDPEDVTSQIVESFGKYYEERRTEKYDPDVTLSAVNLLEVKHLINDIGDFSSMLSQELEKGRYSSLQQIRAGAKSFGAVEEDEQNELYYYDLVDVYSLASGMEEIYSTESGALKQQIEKTVTALYTNVENVYGISLYYPSGNKSLYKETQSEYSIISISDSYYSYLSDLTSEWLLSFSRTWDLGELTSESQEYTLQLSEEQIQNSSEIYYDVLASFGNGEYTICISHCRIQPDSEGKIHIPKDPMVFSLKSGAINTGFWPAIETEYDDNSKKYRAKSTFLECCDISGDLIEDAKRESIYVNMEVPEDTKQVQIKDIRSADDDGMIVGKNTVDISEWEGISCVYSYYIPLRDRIGRLLPNSQWKKIGRFSVYSCPVEEMFSFEMVPASEFTEDFFCQVVLTDTRGESYASELAPVSREHPFKLFKEETKKGLLTYSIYEDHAELIGYEGEDRTIDLPELVDGRLLTVIGENVFANKDFFEQGPPIEMITIPDSVEEIEGNAFRKCDKLSCIRFPAKLKVIGHEAFAGCNSLQEIIIPEGTETIDKAAFAYCAHLKSVQLPGTLIEVGGGLFMQCPELEDFFVTSDSPACSLVDGILYSGDHKTLLAVPGSGVRELNIPEGTEKIAFGAAVGASLYKVIFPESLKTIENFAFYGCYNLNVPIFPPQLEFIGMEAFGVYDSTIERIDIPEERAIIKLPATVSFIGTDSFSGFASKVFIVDADNSRFSSLEGNLTNKAEDVIIQFATGRERVLTIPEGIVSFEWDSMRFINNYYTWGSENEKLEIYFPDTVKIFPNPEDVSVSSNFAFGGSMESEARRFADECGIPYLILENTNDTTEVIDSGDIIMKFNVFSDHAVLTEIESSETKTEVLIPAIVNDVPVTVLGNGFSPIFIGSDHSLRVKIPDSVTEIRKGAFSNGGFYITNLPDNLKIIGEEAITLGEGATSLKWPENLEYIGKSCINGYMPPFILNSHIKKIEPGAFCDCVYLEEFKMVNENDFYTVKDGMLYSKDEKTLIACPTGFKGSIIIPEGTEEIGEEAFLGNHDLQEVYIPKTVRQIKESAFRSTLLKKVQFSEGLLSIGNTAFQGNFFTEIIFPDTLEEIGEDAFSHCYDLRRIRFSENLKTIGNNAFYGCNKIEQVKLPERLEFIGDTVFADRNSVFSSSTQDTLVIGKELKAMGNAPFGSIAVRDFDVDPDNPNFSDVDGFLTDKTGRILLECPAGRKGIITIPEGIEIIANYAFYYATDVTDLKLPGSLTSIEVLALHDKLKEREKNEITYEAN